MPVATVILAPIVYIKVVVVEKLVVGSQWSRRSTKLGIQITLVL